MPAHLDGRRPEQRIVEAAAVLPAVGGVTGWAAMRWLGGAWFDGLDRDGTSERPVCVAATDIRCPPGVALSEERLDPGLLTEVDGVVVTVPVRSLSFEMRYAGSARDAALMFDLAAYSDLVSVHDLVEFLPGLNGWTGVPQMRDAIPLTDENAWSPQEVRMRHIWTLDAGFPPPLCNRPLFDRRGHHIGTPDLLDLEAGLIGEYEGSLHLAGRQRVKDRDREERYRAHGLEVVVMMRGDAIQRGRLVARLHAARERARFEAESVRSWTADLPPWWVPTFTVAQRRALDPAQRSRLLRLRRTV